MNNNVIRAAAALATATVVAGAVATGPAQADTRLNLPGATTSEKVGGSTVTVTLKDHTAVLSPGMVSLPSTRNAWVSGNLSVKIDGKPARGGIAAGYLVGCQVNIGTAGVDLGAKVNSGVGFNSANSNSPLSVAPTASGTTGGSIKLSAGKVGAQFLTFERATWPKAGDEIDPTWETPATNFKYSGNSGSLSYTDQTIGVDGCGGYAQAKFFAKVKATVGNTQSTIYVWGKPFTLG